MKFYNRKCLFQERFRTKWKGVELTKDFKNWIFLYMPSVTDKTSKAEIIELFKNHVSSGKARVFTSFGMDFIFGKREGIYVWDVETGKELINCHCNGGVFNLGHRNPEIIRTLKEALEEIDIGNHHLISKWRALLAKRMAELMPGDISYTVFGVSGGEAIDLAIKIARAYTKRHKIISAKGGYHGHTGFALATGDEKYKKPFEPLAPGFYQVPFNDLEALERAVDSETAAVIFETVPATLGIYVPDRDYFKGVREICDKKGALMIIDEIQTGLGRTGKMWGIEHFGVVPDILVTGKGLSGGIYPITATSFRPHLESVFNKDPFIHVSTFGGSEPGCAVALKVLEISSSEEFLQHVNRMAEFFKRELNSLREKNSDVIQSIRQLGLMMGIKMRDENWGMMMTRACYESGLLCIYANNDPSVLQFLPPLIIKEDEAKEVIRRLENAFSLARTRGFQARVTIDYIKEKIRKAFDRTRMLWK
jgi:acetylornithine/succinyldiaminopimelate/putrescine aminotransferase